MVFYGAKIRRYDEHAVSRLLKNGYHFVMLSVEEISSHNSASETRNCIVIAAGEKTKGEVVATRISESKVKRACITIDWEELEYECSETKTKIEEIRQIIPSTTQVAVVLPLINDIRLWKAWLKIRLKGVGVVLFICGSVEESLIMRWSTEELSGLIISGNNINMRGKQMLLDRDVLRICAKFQEAGGINMLGVTSEDVDPMIFLDALKEVEAFERPEPFRDYLIDPLQPLVSNLALDVYDRFEKDTVKYSQYRNAIMLALRRFMLGSVRILVAGAGKGPLVDICVSAAKDLDLNFQIDAVEKNPNCYELLEEKNKSCLWNNEVRLLKMDVRNWKDTSYDIIVSELLGSFGCNELCPEILANFTHPETIMIPQKYSSFLRPVFYKSLNRLLLQQKEKFYLVGPSSYYSLAEVKKVWDFYHPATMKTERDSVISFRIEHGGTINAFEGFFSAKLFGDVYIGNSPLLEEGACSSWYSSIFPIDDFECNEEDYLTIHLRRTLNRDKVWYEWTFNGRTYNKSGSHCSFSLV